MPTNFWYILFSLLSLGLLGGCGAGQTQTRTDPAAASIEARAERDSVLAVLASIEQEAFRQAFASLPSYAYTRSIRTEQLDERGTPVATTERTVRYEVQGARRTSTVMEGDAAGQFEFGVLRSFASTDVSEEDPTDVGQHLLPEDPAYLSERNREAYAYRFRPDTLRGGVRARAVEIEARPGTGDKHPIRLVRLYIDPRSGDVIGLHLEREKRALLFREETRVDVQLRPGPGGEWVPHHLQARTHIRIPLIVTQRFQTASTFSDFVSAG